MADTVVPLFRLVYRSQLTISPEERNAEIASILDDSRVKNVDRDITGALLVWQDYVVQTLEGEESVVRGLYEKIAVDPRHEAVTLLEAQAIESRNFAKWSMARISDNDQPSGMPILTNKHEGEAPEPGHETREADPVISKMRGYATGESALTGPGSH
ncbi:BLUF domain-containing protein [Pseudonocardia saturnea]